MAPRGGVAGGGVDDTQRLVCVLEAAHTVAGHTEYSICVKRGAENWRVSHRYNDFANLQSTLQQSNVQLPFPPKKIIGNMNPEFIAERRNALQIYLDAILNNHVLSHTLAVKMFLDPRNYPPSMSELALQNVSMALRGDGYYEVKNSMPNIGWRLRKHYYTVAKTEDSLDSYLMSWQTYGPDRIMSDIDMQAVFKCLANTKHPHIDKIVFIHCLETGVYAVKKIHDKGSIKDQLYQTQYKNAYIGKYSNPKQCKRFTIGQIAHYGYQILQALKYLRDIGFPYGHLHTGNIMVENQRIILTDLENCLIGVPMYYRPFILKHKKINTIEDIEIYSFGRVLYELTFGAELADSTCDVFAFVESNELMSVLKMILTSNACRNGMPKIETLLAHSFFNVSSEYRNIYEHESMKNCCKFPAVIREQLKRVAECTESRIKSDQKLLHKERKEVKIQEILSSKPKKLKKKDGNISRSQSLNGLVVQNGQSERSESVASTSSASSHTPPNTSEPAQSQPVADTKRTLLLDSICAFNKTNLRSVKS